VLTVKGLLDLGPHCIVSRGAQLHADGVMRIGFGAGIAERATLFDTSHTFDDVPTCIFDKPVEQADLTVGAFAFIGTNAVVMPGVTIGRSAVLAALSVATRDVPPYTLAAGAPAKVVRPVDGRLERNTLAGAPAATE
jgi:acetyltransferase-like isoleucine patch superfamily enzyme